MLLEKVLWWMANGCYKWWSCSLLMVILRKAFIYDCFPLSSLMLLQWIKKWNSICIVLNKDILKSERKETKLQNHCSSTRKVPLKGWLTFFFLGLIVFMGCSLTCVHASFFKKRIIFHIIYLYSTPLCPFSDKRLDLFPVFMKPLPRWAQIG